MAGQVSELHVDVRTYLSCSYLSCSYRKSIQIQEHTVAINTENIVSIILISM